jgi:hypothetical protein
LPNKGNKTHGKKTKSTNKLKFLKNLESKTYLISSVQGSFLRILGHLENKYQHQKKEKKRKAKIRTSKELPLKQQI